MSIHLSDPDHIEIARTIRSHHPSARTQSELQLQDALEALFRKSGFSYQREFHLSVKDRPDFWFPGTGVVLEVKVAKGLMDILRQLERYARHSCVKSLILVTQRPKSENPDSISGKPLTFIETWRWNL